jgi:hypothetical protein
MPRDIEIDSVRLNLPRSPSPSALQALYPFITMFSSVVMPHKLMCFSGSPQVNHGSNSHTSWRLLACLSQKSQQGCAPNTSGVERAKIRDSALRAPTIVETRPTTDNHSQCLLMQGAKRTCAVLSHSLVDGGFITVTYASIQTARPHRTKCLTGRLMFAMVLTLRNNFTLHSPHSVRFV